MKKDCTRVYGVIGDPVAHSLSPIMQNGAFDACNLDCCYLPFRVAAEDLPVAVAAVRVLGLGGLNVTIPHKELVLPLLDEVEQSAAMIGAVNTIVNRDGRLVGYNTDGAGFLASLRADAGFDPNDKMVVLLGAGGAARAVSFGLVQSGVGGLAIFDIDSIRAERLANDLAPVARNRITTGEPASAVLTAALAEADLLINATPVGMFPDHQAEPPVGLRQLAGIPLVYDLVYNPPRTRLLVEAAARGCQVMNGTGMLVYQGALAFELWTGWPAPVVVMRQALNEAL